MGMLPSKKKLDKKKYEIENYYLNLENTIKLKRDVVSQKHRRILEKRIYEDNANFLNPRELDIYIYDPETKEFVDPIKIKQFLMKRDFLMKNLHNENKINEFGKGPYFIFANDNELNFITVDIYNDEYDELGNLVKSTFNYDPYNKDDNKVMITETIKIINKKWCKLHEI
ncbi:hypothetical protein [Spiroplasma sp. SV19]|uniref:hypothetical protein n=1 Tax=Spiroplasma sp. SV19 TaxID=2570468 RepID=UPI0024B65DC9|nr:hypothetical protein [Spiroplasma sp. SV19]WHQ37189.1 hypothetical protein E7Y35_04780 [Spiroplasma sp. SV19]